MEELNDLIENLYPEMPDHDCKLESDLHCDVCEAYWEFAQIRADSDRLEEDKWATYYQVTGASQKE